MAAPRRAPRDQGLWGKVIEQGKGSGLDEAQIKKLRWSPLSADEVQRALASDKLQAAGMRIPYWDLKGKPTEFFRIRYLEPLPGFAGLVEKPQRYVQPARTLNEVYLPPLLKDTWEEVAKNVSTTIYITEGEKKAACACAHDLACIGLGGVDMWRASRRGIAILPQLAAIDWKNRQVVIVFDSDAAINPNVVRAQRQLAAELLAKGSFPSVATLPARKDGSKQGLDDLLVAEGPGELLSILANSPGFPEASALWEMNEEVVYVSDPGLVIERENGRRMEPGRFAAHHYANRHYMEVTINAKGQQTLKRKPLAKRWIEWEGRFECSKVVYEPGAPRLVDGAWNQWSGWGVQPRKGNVDLWHRLLDHIFGDQHESRAWFEKWCAYPLQRPGSKLLSAAVVWGVHHGTGKSLVGYLLKAIYGANGVELDSATLQHSFTAWAENRQFVMGEEITAGETRIDKEKFKTLVTREQVRINQKFMPEYWIRDCINYYLTGNGPDMLYMDDEDRRYFIHEVLAGRLDPAIVPKLNKWLHGDKDNSSSGEGPAILFHYLLNDVNVSDFDPKAPALVTTAKKNMIVHNRSELGAWCRLLAEDPLTALKPLRGYLGDKLVEEGELFSPRQLLRAFDPERLNRRVNESVLGRELNKVGIRQANGASTVRTSTGTARYYAVRNQGRWSESEHNDVAKYVEQIGVNQKF